MNPHHERRLESNRIFREEIETRIKPLKEELETLKGKDNQFLTEEENNRMKELETEINRELAEVRAYEEADRLQERLFPEQHR